MPRQPLAVDPGSAQQAAGGAADAAQGGADGIERRRHPRIRLDDAAGDTVATALRSPDRRQGGDRRGSGNLRDNVGWTVAANTGSRLGSRLQFRFKKSRFVVLGIAIVAGGIAAYIATQIGRPAPPPEPVAVLTATTQVLVAGRSIAGGERIREASLAWQSWPQDGLQSDYITATTSSAALPDMAQYVARSQFLPGDPIRREKLTEGAGGFMSAALGDGMRAISIAVNSESASGGFITPGDRVDVVLTRAGTGAIGGAIPRSETILHNVQVLAIDANTIDPGTLGPAPDEQKHTVFSGHAVATLALSPADADLVITASTMGKLTLLLRPIADLKARDAKAAGRDSANQAIRMSSPFWLQ